MQSWPVWDPLRPHLFAATTYAEYYGIADPTTSLMSQLAVLLLAKASYAEAEPLMKRALAIDEAGYGPDHPDVARDLNNLAMLLQATNRLEETEPLMRQTLVIFLKFTRSTKHLHPNLKTAIRNYDHLLEAVGLGAPEIDRRHYEIGKEAGLDRAAFGKLLSPLSH